MEGNLLFYAVLCLCILSYAIFIQSENAPLPVPKGVFYYQPNDTRALLAESARVETQLLAAVSAQRLAGNRSRALDLYGLAFLDQHAALASVVDYVNVHNKLRRSPHFDRDAHHLLTALQSETDDAAAAPKGLPAVALDAAASAVAASTTLSSAASSAAAGLSEDDMRVLRERVLRRHNAPARTEGTGASLEPVRVHAIFAADNGTFSGFHELSFIFAAMRYKTPLAIDDCGDAAFGFFARPVRDALTLQVKPDANVMVPVVAVTTGIYVTNAAACTAAVMALPMFAVQSATFLGTAGVSPVVGGGNWRPRPSPMRERYHTDSGRSPAVSAEAKEAPTDDASQPSFRDRRAAHQRRHRQVSLSPEQHDARRNPQCQAEWTGMVPSTPTPSASSTSAGRKVALGSVCVTFAATLQECGICTEETPVTSLCSRPRCTLHESTMFFGPCAFAHPQRQFAEQMKAAMFTRPLPSIPEAVRAGMERYWEEQEAVPEYTPIAASGTARVSASTRHQASGPDEEGTDENELVYEYNRAPPDAPMLLNCAEVDTSQILAGVRSDVLCREYAYQLLRKTKPQRRHTRKGEASSEEASEEPLFPPEELTCVQAMEGTGFLHVMTRLYPSVPSAIVRAASNYDMLPLRKVTYHPPSPSSARSVVPSRGPDAKVEEEEQDRTAFSTAPDGEAKDLRAAEVSSDGDVVAHSVSSTQHGAVGAKKGNHTDHSRATAAAGDDAADVDDGVYVAWEQKEDFMSAADYEAFVKASFRYAVETASAVVLNYFLRDDSVLPGDGAYGG